MFFNKINDWILLQAGASWDNPENFNYISDDFKTLMVDLIRNRLKNIHLKKYLETDFPGSKSDPHLPQPGGCNQQPCKT